MERGEDEEGERAKREKRGKGDWESERKNILRKEGRRPIKNK